MDDGRGGSDDAKHHDPPYGYQVKPTCVLLIRQSYNLSPTPFAPSGHFPLAGGRVRFSASSPSATANVFAPSQGERPTLRVGRGGGRPVIRAESLTRMGHSSAAPLPIQLPNLS